MTTITPSVIEETKRLCAAAARGAGEMRMNAIEELSSAVFSECGKYRYRLDRVVAEVGIVIAFFGVNPSKAGAMEEDQTTRKWRGFTIRNDGRKYIAGNPFAFCSTDVKQLAKQLDPYGPENARYLKEIISEADLLVPCWGNTKKVPKQLRWKFNDTLKLLLESGKPVKIFGRTSGVTADPLHPLMLPYSTQLVSY